MCKKVLLIYILIVVLIVVAGCNQESAMYYSTDTEYSIVENTQHNPDISEEKDVDEYEMIPVYICGAVKNPGVYYMSKGALKADALESAGGFVEAAASDYVNLAETVNSGEKIYFPYEDEVSAGYNVEVVFTDESLEQGKININTATKEELMTLPGVGDKKAEDIIHYREEHGPFQYIEDITNIPGIKEGVYNNIKEHIVVN